MGKYYINTGFFALFMFLLAASNNAQQILGLYYSNSQCSTVTSYLQATSNACVYNSVQRQYKKVSVEATNSAVFYNCTDSQCKSCTIAYSVNSNNAACTSIGYGQYLIMSWSTSCTNLTSGQQILILKFIDNKCTSYLGSNIITNNVCYNIGVGQYEKAVITSNAGFTKYLCSDANCLVCSTSYIQQQAGACQYVSAIAAYEQILWSQNCNTPSITQLSAGAIAGIVIGAVCLVVILYFIKIKCTNQSGGASVAVQNSTNNNQFQQINQEQMKLQQNQFQQQQQMGNNQFEMYNYNDQSKMNMVQYPQQDYQNRTVMMPSYQQPYNQDQSYYTDPNQTMVQQTQYTQQNQF